MSALRLLATPILLALLACATDAAAQQPAARPAVSTPAALSAANPAPRGSIDGKAFIGAGKAQTNLGGPAPATGQLNGSSFKPRSK